MTGVRRCGDRALLLDLESIEAVIGRYDALRADPPPGVTELVPAARTLLVAFDPRATAADRLAADLAARPAGAGERAAAGVVEVPVRYDGADLADVARITGLAEEEVVRRHAGADYTVAFCGFSPGFGYLTGLPPELHLPRRDTPRTKVPAGAVAIAGEYAGVYPRPSPGGWQLLGSTDVVVWDLDRDPPALLTPGTRVRFVVVA